MKLTLKRKTFVKLFEVLGFKTAETWDDKKLLSNIKKLPEFAATAKVKSPKARKLLKSIINADEVGIKAEETAVEEAEATKKTSSKKKKTVIKKTAAKADTKKKKKPADTKKKTIDTKKKTTTKSDTALDAFGSRLGSNNAKINKCLSKKPKKMSQLIKEANLSGTYYEHAKSLIEKKFIIKSKEGYSLKK